LSIRTQNASSAAAGPEEQVDDNAPGHRDHRDTR